jgi:hypothetical protein
MWHAHRLGGGRDRSGIDERDILTNAPDRHVRPKRFAVEGDVATAKLGANALPERQHRLGACTDPEVDDPRPTGRRKTARAVQLHIERGHGSRCGFDGSSRVGEPFIRRSAEERERHVHELRLHAPERGKIRRTTERRLGDLDREWECDEKPYPRRLEPCGLDLVSDKQRDEHDPEDTTETGERGGADTLAARDEFPCVGDQSTHSDT